jgi:type VI secretion system protein ImpK
MVNTFSQTISGQTMNIDLSKNSEGTETLGTLSADIFTIICKMKEQQDLGTPESLRKLLKEYLRIYESNCCAVHVDSAIIESTKYALVALIDETVLSIPGQCAEYWMTRPLQFEIWGEILAGEKFYDYLDSLLQNPEKNYDALEIFYLCLSLGFSGKFLDDQETREKVIYLTAKALVKAHKEKAPRKNSRAAASVKSRRSLHASGWVIVSAAMLVIMLGWACACIMTGYHSSEVVKEINSLF